MSLKVKSKIKKWGKGSGILISKDILLTCGLELDTEIDIIAENNLIVIRKREPSILDLLNEYEGFYEGDDKAKEWQNMGPIGEE
jgi:antitoxin component of MazEF toxin-antitoxin module